MFTVFGFVLGSYTRSKIIQESLTECECVLSVKTVAIIGFGQLGSSLGMALRGRGVRRVGWSRRPESRAKALADDVVDAAADTPEAALAEADLCVLCLPIPNTVEFALAHAGAFKPGSVVTDVGSVKRAIVAPVAPALRARGVGFVGGHPMAGSEKSGAEAARPGLYQGATVFVTPAPGGRDAEVEAVEAFWRLVGAVCVRIGAEEHDAVVARSSHVAHVSAIALVEAALGAGNPLRGRCWQACAGGFRDSTRIASSNPRMWREIFEANQAEVLQACDAVAEVFASIRADVARGDFDAFERAMARAKELRDRWLEDYNAGKVQN